MYHNNPEFAPGSFNPTFQFESPGAYCYQSLYENENPFGIQQDRGCGYPFQYPAYLQVHCDDQSVKYFPYAVDPVGQIYEDLSMTSDSDSSTTDSLTHLAGFDVVEDRLPTYTRSYLPNMLQTFNYRSGNQAQEYNRTPVIQQAPPPPLEQNSSRPSPVQNRETVLCYWPKQLAEKEKRQTDKEANNPNNNTSDTDSEGPEVTGVRSTTEHGNLQCKYCGTIFTRSYSLKRHVQRVHKKGANFCPKCRKHYGHLNDLQKHMKSCIQGLVYQCPAESCRKVLRSIEAFRRHLSQHEKQACDFYDTYLSSQLSACVHSQETLCNSIPTMLSFCCPLCQKTFLQKSLFKRHLLIHLSVEDGNEKFLREGTGQS